jgi:hypothetical protein
VFDQYLSFIALEPSLFSLGLPNSYLELNDPAARDSQIEVREGGRELTMHCSYATVVSFRIEPYSSTIG